MSNRQRLVVGNWKMHGSQVSVIELARAVAGQVAGLSASVVLCPTFVHLAGVLSVITDSDVALGAQNCSEHASGAYTGEVAATMLADTGCRYVIVGHSERRQLFNETSRQVARKAASVLAASMVPILCVGETLEQRENDAIESVIGEQLDAVIDVVGSESIADLVVAYEPVWAIGTGKTATPEQAQDVHAMIRRRLAAVNAGSATMVQILYGGSVKPDNAAALFDKPDIDGGLIGGAALDASAFVTICQAAAHSAA